MKLFHYSAEPFRFDPYRTYEDDHWKPAGLWVSVKGDDDWTAWCVVELLKHANEVVLNSNANVLLIDTTEKLDAFNARFRCANDDLDLRNINWSAVKNLYDGLIIAPYQWERRHTFRWYYGWDCASGVIWNMAAVEKVTPGDKRE